jgi:hypothetical protein
MEGLQEKSQRLHRSPHATPEDIIRKTGEIRRMEGSAGHTVFGGEAVRQGGRGKPQPWRAGAAAVRATERFIACYGIPELLRLFISAREFHSSSAHMRRQCAGSMARYNALGIAQLWKSAADKAPHIRCGIP